MKKKSTCYRTYGMALTLLMMCFMSLSARAISPAEVFEKGKAKIAAARTLQADFIMKINGNQISGKILAKGTKFAVTSGFTSSWYNGTSLYTYDSAAGETYLFNPTQNELQQANPLLYLSAAQDYRVTGSKTKKSGVETIVLIPKKTGSGVKSITIELDSKTYLPKVIKIIPSSGNAVELTVSKVKLNQEIANSTFEYPKSKYSNIPVVDMR